MSLIPPQAPNLPNQGASNFNAPQSSAGDEFKDAFLNIASTIIEGDTALHQAATQDLPSQQAKYNEDYQLYQHTNTSQANKVQDTAVLKTELAAANLQQQLAQDILKQSSKTLTEKPIVLDNEGQHNMAHLNAGSDIAAAFAATVNKSDKEQHNQVEQDLLHNPLQQADTELETVSESVPQEPVQAPVAESNSETNANMAMPSIQVSLESTEGSSYNQEGALKFSSQPYIDISATVASSQDLTVISQAGLTTQPFTPISQTESSAAASSTDTTSIADEVSAALLAQVNQHQLHLLNMRSTLNTVLAQTLNSMTFAPSAADTASEDATNDQTNMLFSQENLAQDQIDISNIDATISQLISELTDIAATGVDSNAEFARYQALSAQLQAAEINLNTLLSQGLSTLYITPFEDENGNILSPEQVDALSAEDKEAVLTRQQAADAALVIDGNQSFLAAAYQDLQRQMIDFSTMNEEINGVPFIATEFPSLASVASYESVSTLFSSSVIQPSYQPSNVDIYTKAEEETGEFFDAIAQFVAAFNNPDPNADKSLTLRDGTYIENVSDLTGLTVFGHWIKLAQSLLEIVTGVYNYLVNAEKKLHSASQN